MIKKILFAVSFLLTGSAAMSQNLPTIYDYTVDTLCHNDYDEVFITITLEDIDGDSSYIDVVTLNNGFIDSQSFITVTGPTYVPGATLRTFTISGTPYWGNPTGLNMASINIEVVGNLMNDPGGTDYDINDIPVDGPVQMGFTTSGVEVCTNGAPLDLDAFAVQQGGQWSWLDDYFEGTYTESNVIDPKIAYQVDQDAGGDGYAVDYTYINNVGCMGYDYFDLYFNDAPTVSVTPTTSTCLNADGMAVASITNGAAPYDVYWTTGLTEQVSSVSTVANLSSGVYYINITDANGCQEVGIANISDSDIGVGSTITPVYCAGTTGQVNLNITPQTGTVSEIYWSNGQTAANMVAPAGEYAVSVHTTTNCNYYGTYVIADSALKVKIEDYYDNYDCVNPSGYVDITTVGGTGSGTYNWNWTKNSSPFAVTEDLNGIFGGVYQCTVTDGNSCTYTWDKTIGNYGSNSYAWVENITKAVCNGSNGSIDVMVDTVWGDIPSYYQWSNGATTEDLTNVPVGTYTLTYADQAGCENYLTAKIIYEKPYQPSVCMLTVDTSLTYNQVVWEKIPGMGISGFNIYRETSVFGVFEKVATRPYALESFFIDNSASPVDRSWRYYISTYDACGNESFGSFAHKTIHTVANTTNGTDYTVSWDKYEGITYSSVDLFRHDATNGWQNIGTFGTTQLSTADTPPVLAGLDYIVSFNLADPCTSTKAQDYNSSRSNNSSAIYDPGNSTTTIEDEDIGQIMIYPNPTNGLLNIYLEQPESFELVELRDANGRIVYSDIVTSTQAVFDLGELSQGIYFVRLVANDKTLVRKVIKQ